jgi:hypothetical protein
MQPFRFPSLPRSLRSEYVEEATYGFIRFEGIAKSSSPIEGGQAIGGARAIFGPALMSPKVRSGAAG